MELHFLHTSAILLFALHYICKIHTYCYICILVPGIFFSLLYSILYYTILWIITSFLKDSFPHLLLQTLLIQKIVHTSPSTHVQKCYNPTHIYRIVFFSLWATTLQRLKGNLEDYVLHWWMHGWIKKGT